MSKEEINRALFKIGRKPPGPESIVLRDVLEFLNIGIRNCVAWRQNTGSHTFPGSDGRTRFVRYGVPGQGDITGLLRGYRLEAEVKRRGKQPTPLQAAWLDMVRQSGGVSFWCDSIPSCIERLEEEFGRRGWKWGT